MELGRQKVAQAANRLKGEGFPLPEVVSFLIREAARSPIGASCRIGFELVFVLPPLLWLRRGRHR